MTRPLPELCRRARPLAQLDSGLREACIRIAERYSPSACLGQVKRLPQLSGWSQIQRLGVTKATRWLAVIRRDHGQQAFSETAGLLRGRSAGGSWRLASGEQVQDREDSHLHGGVVDLLPEVLGEIRSGGRLFVVQEVDLGRTVGQSTCVRTGPGDVVVYAQREGRNGHTRFVKNRQAEPCAYVAVILRRLETGVYELVTAYIGRLAPREPFDPKARQEAFTFWHSHALIWGSEPVVPGTETTRCPW